MTSPNDEIKKIKYYLQKQRMIDFVTYSLKEIFEYKYSLSEFTVIEPSFDMFLNKIIFRSYNENDFQNSLLSYCRLCELFLNLYSIEDNYYAREFEMELKQLLNTILWGLDKCGYTIGVYKNKKVAIKRDEAAEAVATTNIVYKNTIFDYLIAKTIVEKEKILMSFAIQLEAVRPKDSYSKTNRQFLQLMRHKNEKENDSKYDWFFNDDIYEMNLDKLFRIFLSIVVHDNTNSIIEEFKNKMEK